MSIAVVPWTLRYYVFDKEQVRDTYRKLSDLGFNGVESCMGRSAGLTPEEDLALLKEYGLKVCATYGDVKDTKAVLENAETYGAFLMGLPSIPGIMMHSVEGFRTYAHQLNELVKPYRGTGMHFQYHNHSQEFRNFPELNGKTGMDILLEETDPELIAFELDTFWASAAGCDPAQWVEKLKGRIHVIHYKDMAVNYQDENVNLGEIPWQFSEVGQGNLNFEAITAACRKVGGIQWYNVEQDRTKRPVFESLKLSIDYMRNVLHIQ